MPYYTERLVKGKGTGGQFNIYAPKSIEMLNWILSQPQGARLTRNGLPCSHHIADGVLQFARREGLVRGGVRTAKSALSLDAVPAPSVSPAPSVPPAPPESAGHFVKIRRSQCLVVHPYQRRLLSPPWPERKWGEFDLAKFYDNLEPVTVIHASLVKGLGEWQCVDHGPDCNYTVWPGAEYVVLGGQHRTQEGGRVHGPDWEFWAVEWTKPVALERLGRSWWVTEDRRVSGSREKFAKKLQDGEPEYVEMAEVLHSNGFTYRRGEKLRDFTAIGSVETLWKKNPDAVRVMVAVLGASGCDTRQPLVRALFELASWDAQEHAGVRWGDLEAKLSRRVDEPRKAELGNSVDGKVPWQRVASYLGRIYNTGRQPGNRIVFPDL